MTITRHDVADQLAAYLRGEAELSDLVEWAEGAVMDADFETPAARDAAALLGVADVRAFGPTWNDCRDLLKSLGYDARVEVVA